MGALRRLPLLGGLGARHVGSARAVRAPRALRAVGRGGARGGEERARMMAGGPILRGPRAGAVKIASADPHRPATFTQK